MNEQVKKFLERKIKQAFEKENPSKTELNFLLAFAEHYNLKKLEKLVKNKLETN
jgi:hypothetical protein